MTYNIGGGHMRGASEKSLIVKMIRDVSPDILAIQEAAQWLDAEGLWHSDLDEIAEALGKEFEYTVAPTLTMKTQMHPNNKAMMDALFNDCQDWQQGNALVSRWPFHRLASPGQPGVPHSIPLYRSPVYEGSRDTEPRSALVARIGRAPQFPIVIGLHLSTLVGERGEDIVPGKPEQAAQLREMETQRLLNLLREHVLDAHEIVFLLGDFNATIDEPSIRRLLDEGEFIPAAPINEKVSTHPEAGGAIDHIFLFPSSRVVEFKSSIVETEEAHQASDHLPVVTEVTVV
jgi:endonuclease/exonuclease/phosphatase family metal-dependent hydrolase